MFSGTIMPQLQHWLDPCIGTVRHNQKNDVNFHVAAIVAVLYSVLQQKLLYAKTPRSVQRRRVNGRSMSRLPRQYPLRFRFHSQPQPFALATDPNLQLGPSTWSYSILDFFSSIHHV